MVDPSIVCTANSCPKITAVSPCYIQHIGVVMTGHCYTDQQFAGHISYLQPWYPTFCRYILLTTGTTDLFAELLSEAKYVKM